MKLVVLTVGCVVSLATSPVALADGDDDAYLSALQTIGVTTTNPVAATTYGRGLCDHISEVGFDGLVGIVKHDMSDSISMHQAALMVGSAVANYCIDKIPLLPKTLTY